MFYLNVERAHRKTLYVKVFLKIEKYATLFNFVQNAISSTDRQVPLYFIKIKLTAFKSYAYKSLQCYFERMRPRIDLTFKLVKLWKRRSGRKLSEFCCKCKTSKRSSLENKASLRPNSEF